MNKVVNAEACKEAVMESEYGGKVFEYSKVLNYELMAR